MKRFSDQNNLLKQLIKEEVKRSLIYEGLLFSYPPSIVFNKLKAIGFNDVRYDKNKNIFSINFVLDINNIERYKKLNNFLDNVCGWSHGLTLSNGNVVPDKTGFFNVENGNAFLQYEAKFDIKVDKIPDEIYHLTTEKKLDKILKNGLTPKGSVSLFNYGNRIYFSLKTNGLLEFSKRKSILSQEDTFIILKINTKQINVGTRFFKDPNFVNGIYTLENISPNSITPINKVYVDGGKVDVVPFL